MTNKRKEKIKEIMLTPNKYPRPYDFLLDYFISELEKAKQEVLDYIALGEGWEETRDFYAEKLGLTVKYKK